MDLTILPKFFTRRGRIADWACIIVLLIATGIINLGTKPYQWPLTLEDMNKYKHPMKKHETVPNFAVPIYSIIGPAVFIFGTGYKLGINAEDIHSALQGLGGAVSTTLLLTDATKNYIGRPRPDFYYRCWPEGVTPQMLSDTVPDCRNGTHVQEGRKSFFSGHASLSAAGLTYTTFFLALLLRTYHVWRRETLKGALLPLSLGANAERTSFLVVALEAPFLTLVVSLLPSIGAMLVAMSRVKDYRHHVSDVVVGYCVGLVCSYLCFRLYFPPPLDLIPSTGPAGTGPVPPSSSQVALRGASVNHEPLDVAVISMTGPTSSTTALRPKQLASSGEDQV